MKKFIILALALVLTMALFAGCRTRETMPATVPTTQEPTQMTEMPTYATEHTTVPQTEATVPHTENTVPHTEGGNTGNQNDTTELLPGEENAGENRARNRVSPVR